MQGPIMLSYIMLSLIQSTCGLPIHLVHYHSKAAFEMLCINMNRPFFFATSFEFAQGCFQLRNNHLQKATISSAALSH